MHSSIFISYRRSDASAEALELCRALRQKYGKRAVFSDTSSLFPGEQWPRRLDAEIKAAKIVLIVIGPNWLGSSHNRIQNESDWVRKEVTRALERLDRKVVPLLVRGAELPAVADLPPDLRPILDLQSFSIRSESWQEDTTRLMELLGTAEEVHPQRAIAEAIRNGVKGGLLGGIVGGLIIAWAYGQKKQTDVPSILGIKGIAWLIRIYAPVAAMSWAISAQLGIRKLCEMGKAKPNLWFIYNEITGCVFGGVIGTAMIGAIGGFIFHVTGDGQPRIGSELSAGVLAAGVCILVSTLVLTYKAGWKSAGYSLMASLIAGFVGAVGLFVVFSATPWDKFFNAPAPAYYALFGGLIMAASFSTFVGVPIGAAVWLNRVLSED
jgi:hypothetical protein